MEFKLGLVSSPKDKRDYILASFLPPLKVSLPKEWLEWQAWQTPVKYQSNLGSCVAFASGGQKEGYDYKELGAAPDLSEQFLYGKCKEIDGMPNVEGTFIRAAMSVLKNFGVCEESYFPYEARFPPINAPKTGYLENAAKYKISTYASVGITKESLMTALFQNGPLVIGISVHDSFINTGSNGIVQFPSGKSHGGHAVLAIGYNNLGLVCKNSWDFFWGARGYCTIPWAVWEQINLGEAWSVVDMKSGIKPWEDLESELELGWLVKNRGIMQGYTDGLFYPYKNVTQRQVVLVAKRLGLPVHKKFLGNYTTLATRGWVHSLYPQFLFVEKRWGEFLTRFQFMVIVGRYLKDNIKEMTHT